MFVADDADSGPSGRRGGGAVDAPGGGTNIYDAKTAIFTMIAATVVIALSFQSVCADPHIPVEVWRVGDDGLSMKLSDAVETEFKASPRFILSSGKRSGTLIVTIPTNVGWKQFGKRMQIRYSVEFSSIHQEKLGSKTGVCWEDSMQDCATQVVKAAVIAAKRLSTNARNSDN